MKFVLSVFSFLLILYTVVIAAEPEYQKSCLGDFQQSNQILDQLSNLLKCSMATNINNCTLIDNNKMMCKKNGICFERDLARRIALDSSNKAVAMTNNPSNRGVVSKLNASQFMKNQVLQKINANPELKAVYDAMQIENSMKRLEALRQLGVTERSGVVGPHNYLIKGGVNITEGQLAVVHQLSRARAPDLHPNFIIGFGDPSLAEQGRALAAVLEEKELGPLGDKLNAFNRITGAKIEGPKADLEVKFGRGFAEATKVEESGALAGSARVTKSLIKKSLPILLSAPVASYMGCKMSKSSLDCASEGFLEGIDSLTLGAISVAGCSEIYSKFQELDKNCKTKSGFTGAVRTFLRFQSSEEQFSELLKVPSFCESIKKLYQDSFPNISALSQCNGDNVKFSINGTPSNEPRQVDMNFYPGGKIKSLVVNPARNSVNSLNLTWSDSIAKGQSSELTGLWERQGRTSKIYVSQNKLSSKEDIELLDKKYFEAAAITLLGLELQKCCDAQQGTSNCKELINQSKATQSAQSLIEKGPLPEQSRGSSSKK